MLDSQGETIHCEVCEMYPATDEVRNTEDQDCHVINVCDTKRCGELARKRIDTEDARYGKHRTDKSVK
jgi:hypothetical protein